MNILIIGHSGSGKTSYIAGLYKLYGDKKEGFGLYSPHERKLQYLSSQLTKGVYPNGTDIADRYNFWLMHNNHWLIPFDLYDYRGGALKECSSWSKDKEDLLEQIEKADALIVFIDGAKAIFEDANIKDEYYTIKWAIQKSLSKRNKEDGVYFPISFVFTKGDLYTDYDDIFSTNAIAEFNPIFSLIKESKAVVGEFSVVNVTKESVSNVEIPLFFSIGYSMYKYINAKIANLNFEIKRYDDATWFEKTFHYGDAKSAFENQVSICERLKELEGLREAIAKILTTWQENDRILIF